MLGGGERKRMGGRVRMGRHQVQRLGADQLHREALQARVRGVVEREPRHHFPPNRQIRRRLQFRAVFVADGALAPDRGDVQRALQRIARAADSDGLEGLHTRSSARSSPQAPT